MSRLFLLIAVGLCLISGVQAQTIVPAPPVFTLDKQLPGEDQFSWSRPTFSGNSKFVAAFAHTTKTVTVWDVASGKVAGTVPLEAHGFDGVDGFEFTNDGAQLIMMRSDKPLTYVDWKAGKVARTLDIKADPKKIIAYDFDDAQNLLVLGTMSNGVLVWDLKAGKKLKSFLPGQAVSSVDYITYKTKQGKWVRQIGWGRALMPPNLKWDNVAGIIDLDSGANSTLLKDVPADKLPPEGAMTFTMVNWQWGGGHLLISYYQIPPKINAGIYLVDAKTKKYVSTFELGQKTLNFDPKYLWKPYYGISISTNDASNPMQPIKSATEFLIFTKDGFKKLDVVDETKLPVQSIRYNANNTLAVVSQKKSMQDKATIYIYKVSPKK